MPQTTRPDPSGSGGVGSGAGNAGTGTSSAGSGAGGAGGVNAGSGGLVTAGGSVGSSAGTGTGGGAGAGGSSGAFSGGVGGSGGFGSSGGLGGGGGGGAGTAGAEIAGSGAGGTGEVTPALYYTRTCSPCHGENGEGTMEGPEVQHPFEDFATWVIRTGRAGHPDYEDDMDAYGTDMLSDVVLSGILELLGSPPQPTSGEGLFRDYCVNCHGADARGGVTGVDISREPLAELIEHAREGAHPGEFSNREEFMPAFDQSVLTDSEIGLISQYLGSL